MGGFLSDAATATLTTQRTDPPYHPAMAIATRTVRKLWLDGQGQPCSGSIAFELARPLEQSDSIAVLMPTRQDITLAGGLMVWPAVVSDEEEPVGTIYRVTPCLTDSTGRPVEPTGLPIHTYAVAIPYGTEDMELPSPTVQTDRYVGVIGPAGVGVMFLLPGQEVPPGHPEQLLIVEPAS